MKQNRFSPRIRILLCGAAFVGAGLIPVNSAQAQVPDAAQTTASPGRVQQQIEERELPSADLAPRVDVDDIILQKVPEGAEDIKFELRSVTLDGVTAYDPAALQGVYADRLGTTISLADLYAIATALTNKYRNDGYILTQVIVPPQTIDGGAVRLQVVEGYVDQISVEGDDAETALNLVRLYARQIRTGKALNVADLERYLLLINDLPGVSARSVLSPSRTQTGAADLRIIVTRDHYDALLSADSHGSRYLGPIQLSAVGTLNSFFGYNERISFQSVETAFPGFGRELNYNAIFYELPIFDNGTKLLASASRTNTDPGHDLRIFDVKGQSSFLSLGVMHPLVRRRSENWNVYSNFDMRYVESKNILETREDHIRALRVGTRYEFLDTLLGVGANALDVSFSKGLGIFGASEKGDTDLSRTFADPTFFKMNFDFQRLQRVTSKVNVLMGVSGQWSAQPLLSSEEFGLGGATNIARGYEPSEIIGDDGLAGKLEVQWNKPYRLDFMPDYQLFGFYEGGSVWNQDATTSKTKRDTLTAAGAGVRADFTPETEGALTVAFPLNRDVSTQQDQDPRVFFSLSRRF